MSKKFIYILLGIIILLYFINKKNKESISSNNSSKTQTFMSVPKDEL